MTGGSRPWPLALGLAMLLGAAGCASVPPPASPPAGERGISPGVVGVGDLVQITYFLDSKGNGGPYRIGPGDVLGIHLPDYPELSRDAVLVLPDGRISLNLIGSVVAGGRTVEDVATEAEARYRELKFRRLRVVVSVVRGQERLKAFLGTLGRDEGVRRLDIRVHDDGFLDLPFVPPVAVGRPLAEIRREIKDAYTREFGGELRVTVNLAARGLSLLYVMGEVKNPGVVEAQPGQNLVTTIAAAGGFADTARPSEILVLRFRPDGSYDHWTFDLTDRAFTDGRASDFRLERGDVVYVAKSTIAKVNAFVEQYIRKNLPFQPSFGAFVPIQ